MYLVLIDVCIEYERRCFWLHTTYYGSICNSTWKEIGKDIHTWQKVFATLTGSEIGEIAIYAECLRADHVSDHRRIVQAMHRGEHGSLLWSLDTIG